MYRLVIADDEFYIREGLCKLDWAAMGIEVAAACKNGAEAAKYIYENPVDILLTDISMPIVSGLELIQDVGRRFPAIKTVALTAYDDFEYIRTCLRCGTVDYVLKPFTEEALKKTFAAVTDILDKEKAEQKRVAELERVNRMKTLALRREWTTSLFRENRSDERMEEISVYCELFLDSPWYFLCAVRPDDMDSLPDADRELAAFSFQNAMEDFCGDGAACFAIDENAACYYLRGFDVPPSEEEQRQLAQAIRGRLYKLRGVFRCPLSAAAALVDDRHRIASCTALLDGWLARAGDDAVRLFSAGELCACPAAAGEEGPEPEEEGAGGHAHLIRMVKEYIRDNYQNPITLQSAAESVFVSQSYLSHVFKVETGQNFVKYLTDYRLREACRLLRETNRRVCDIVGMVGYDSPKYFSEVFKRAFGMTPNAYRRQGGSE